jgi:hypothetical protein
MESLLNQTLDGELSEAEVTRRTLVDLRRRISHNEAIPEDELASALLKIRKAYGAELKANKSAAKKPAAKTAKKEPKVDADALLNGLLGGL